MKGRTALFAPLLVVVAWVLAPIAANAYVDIELDSHRHVLGDSYVVEAGKLIVYRASGAVEIDRGSVRSIHERDGDAPTDRHTSAVPPSGRAVPMAEPRGAVASPATEIHAKEPQAREQELASELMHMRIQRLAATQRGDQESIDKLDKDIQKLQGERHTNWKKLHPEASGGDGD